MISTLSILSLQVTQSWHFLKAQIAGLQTRCIQKLIKDPSLHVNDTNTPDNTIINGLCMNDCGTLTNDGTPIKHGTCNTSVLHSIFLNIINVYVDNLCVTAILLYP